jgi:hypothetical protein
VCVFYVHMTVCIYYYYMAFVCRGPAAKFLTFIRWSVSVSSSFLFSILVTAERLPFFLRRHTRSQLKLPFPIFRIYTLYVHNNTYSVYLLFFSRYTLSPPFTNEQGGVHILLSFQLIHSPFCLTATHTFNIHHNS